jgi:hypothetical protein
VTLVYNPQAVVHPDKSNYDSKFLCDYVCDMEEGMVALSLVRGAGREATFAVVFAGILVKG